MENLENQETLRSIITQEIIENIENYDGVYGADLVYEMYNNNYYIIGIYQAKQFIKKYMDEVFEALEDYQDNFGSMYPDLLDFEKLASLTALYIAGQILNDCNLLTQKQNNKLSKKDLLKIKKELQGQLLNQK